MVSSRLGCRIYEETVMTVGHILNQKGTAVVTARPDDTVHEVGKLLTSRKVGAVVIMDGETIAGIVSERDIVRAIAERGETALKLGVSEIMTRKLEVCSPADTVLDLMNQMTDRRIRHLPVVVDGKLSGIVSIGDVVKQRIAEAEYEAAEMKRYIAAG
jgi:CBS domain-containing protein